MASSILRRRRPGPRLCALGGIVGPAGFVAAWAGCGAATPDYSPMTDAISRLAAAHAPTRWAMTAGFVCFGVAVPAYAVAWRRAVGRPAGWALTSTGLATLGVAALPLGTSAVIDAAHGAMAGIGYLTLAAAPLLSVAPLAAQGRRRAAIASAAVGALSGASLIATLAGPAHGLFQRAGLTLGDLWLAAGAVVLLRARPG